MGSPYVEDDCTMDSHHTGDRPTVGVGQVKSAIAGDGCLRPSLLSSARGLVVSILYMIRGQLGYLTLHQFSSSRRRVLECPQRWTL